MKALHGVGISSIGGIHFVQPSDLSDTGKTLFEEALILESGADAMLEAIRRQYHIVLKSNTLTPDMPPGNYYFIPEEESK